MQGYAKAGQGSPRAGTAGNKMLTATANVSLAGTKRTLKISEARLKAMKQHDPRSVRVLNDK